MDVITLETPIQITTAWGVHTLTHSVLSFEYKPHLKTLKTEMIYGIMSNGEFLAYERQDLIEENNHDKFAQVPLSLFEELLAPDDKGKKANIFRNDDVLKIFKKAKKQERDRKRELGY